MTVNAKKYPHSAREEWRPAMSPFSSSYEVSNFGRVRSLNRNDSCGRRRTGREMAQLFSRGYLAVNLYHLGSVRQVKVHRLVASAFLPNKKLLATVNHRDGNKKNNFVYNLEWSSHSENQKHAFSTGLKKAVYGNCKLNKSRAARIRKELSRGVSHIILADRYGVSESTISLINLGKRWS